MPPHKADCDGTEMDGPCAACHWLRDLDLDFRAFMAFQALFRRIPFDAWHVAGMGAG
jgi:hypothetical protein